MNAATRFYVAYWASLVLSGVFAKGPHADNLAIYDFAISAVWLVLAILFFGKSAKAGGAA